MSNTPQQAAGLNWQAPVWWNTQRSVGMLVSQCERYRIDRVRGSYTSWRRATARDHLNLRLGETEDLREAKQLCEEDLPK